MRAHAGHIAEKAEASETLEKSAVIALYDTHEEAQEAVRELERSGFDMQKLSIVGKDYQTEEVEMCGFSLTMYLLSGWLTRTCPGVDPFSYDFGHLWYTLVGFKGKPHLNPIHLASNLIILGGFILLSSAWRVLFEAQRDGKLATAGPYASVRHPQYVAFMLVMFGFLLQWPTLVTLVMFPVLVTVYVRIARREERDVRAEFGETWDRYAAQTPRFIPRPRRGGSVGQRRDAHA